MSLEAVAKRPAAGSPFCFEFEITNRAVGKWEACFWLSTSPRLRRGGGNVRIAPFAISKGGGRGGKPAFGFPPRPWPGISTAVFRSCAPPLFEAAEQLQLGGLHGRPRRGIGLGSGFPLQVPNRHVGLEMPSQTGQLSQNFPWRRVPRVRSLHLALGVDHLLRHTARPLKVQA